MAATYPAGLPKPLIANYGYRHQETIARTELVTGRAIQRKIYGSVPSMFSANWIFHNDAQAAAFEAWFRDALDNGAGWFEINLKTPAIREPRLARFTGMYSGPTLTGGRYWAFSATLEIQSRPLLPPGEGLFPDEILFSNAFDVSMNHYWPKL